MTEQVHPTESRAGSMLQSIAGLSARAQSSGQAINQGASARLDSVLKRMDELRPTVLTSADAAQEYQALAIERHRLNMVVMQP